MLANNETGVLHPMAEIVRLCQNYGAHLHVDAVQAAGRVALCVEEMGMDSLALSGHKMGGPKGAGALLLRGPAPARLEPLFEGGGQEQGRRGGTPPCPHWLVSLLRCRPLWRSQPSLLPPCGTR